MAAICASWAWASAWASSLTVSPLRAVSYMARLLSR